MGQDTRDELSCPTLERRAFFWIGVRQSTVGEDLENVARGQQDGAQVEGATPVARGVAGRPMLSQLIAKSPLVVDAAAVRPEHLVGQVHSAVAEVVGLVAEPPRALLASIRLVQAGAARHIGDREALDRIAPIEYLTAHDDARVDLPPVGQRRLAARRSPP